MIRFLNAGTLALALAWGSAATAGTIMLTPADPQPTNPASGLAVEYAFPGDVKTLGQAAKILKKSGKPGTPLKGMDYWDTEDGDETLTSGQAHNVVAGITGYVRFDAPGVYKMDALSNDGLQVSIGGQQVIKFDGRHPCEESAAKNVEVPQAGWYDLSALYFQRGGTACLHLRATPEGDAEPVFLENASFGH